MFFHILHKSKPKIETTKNLQKMQNVSKKFFKKLKPQNYAKKVPKTSSKNKNSSKKNSKNIFKYTKFQKLKPQNSSKKNFFKNADFF